MKAESAPSPTSATSETIAVATIRVLIGAIRTASKGRIAPQKNEAAETPAALWLRAKLLRREGKLAEAAASMLQAWKSAHDAEAYTGFSSEGFQIWFKFNNVV